jgi:hypothetical protein
MALMAICAQEQWLNKPQVNGPGLRLPDVQVPRVASENWPGAGPSGSVGEEPAVTAAGRGQTGLSRICFVNRSGEPALVRLVGPTRGEVAVPDGQTGAIERVAAGRYRILIRYGTAPHFRYAEGDPFEVEETAWSYSEVRISLHRVVGGNYHTRPATANSFEAAAPDKSVPAP